MLTQEPKKSTREAELSNAEGVAQIIANYLQRLFRTVLLSYDRPQLERQVDVFLTSLGV